jgi:hypothetical protein
MITTCIVSVNKNALRIRGVGWEIGKRKEEIGKRIWGTTDEHG